MTIFISHGSPDSDFAAKLADDLRANGAKSWIALRDIEVGAHWDSSVQAALQSCSALALVLTPSATASVHVLDELAYVLEQNRPVYPLLLKHCNKPYRVVRLQHIDFTTDYGAALRRLLSEVRRRPDMPPPDLKPRRVFISCENTQGVLLNIVRTVASELGLEPVNAGSIKPGSPARELIVQSISTCDFFVSILVGLNHKDISPWHLWELGVATAMGIPIQLLVQGDEARRAAKLFVPDRQLNEFTKADFPDLTRRAFRQFAAIPPKVVHAS